MTDKITYGEDDLYCPPEFDAKRADEGVWFTDYTPAKNKVGEFKLKLLHPEAPEVKNFMERHGKRYDRMIELAKADSDTMTKEELEAAGKETLKFYADILAECALVDWKRFNRKGEPIQFTKDGARRFLHAEPFAPTTIRLYAIASEVLKFQPLSEDPVKN